MGQSPRAAVVSRAHKERVECERSWAPLVIISLSARPHDDPRTGRQPKREQAAGFGSSRGLLTVPLADQPKLGQPILATPR